MNKKIKRIDPIEWAPLRGVSLLFNNPGHSLLDRGPWSEIRSSAGSSDLALYDALESALDVQRQKQAFNQLGFCAVPRYSYHVTALDGINDGHVEQLRADVRPRWKNFLNGLPAALQHDQDTLLKSIKASDLNNWRGRLSLGFDSLRVWGDGVLVAALAPDDSSIGTLHEVNAMRMRLHRDFIAPLCDVQIHEFVPHVTLGYFAYPEGAKDALAKVPEWEAHMREIARAHWIAFESIDIYGFLDMVRYFKLA